MKESLTTILLLLAITFSANAQGTRQNVSKQSSQQSTTQKSPTSYKECPDENHPHLIDLGLPSGTKWACCNVDAATPEDKGGYYSWGETSEKPTYDWSSYTHCDGSVQTCHNIGNDISGTQYDVVHVKWGGTWRMPTFNQVKEMLDNCTYQWTTCNGVNGGKFTSKKNGASIFLPAAGNRWGEYPSYAGSIGYYWASTQIPSHSHSAYHLEFKSESAFWGNGNFGRSFGQTIRPVSK